VRVIGQIRPAGLPGTLDHPFLLRGRRKRSKASAFRK
jgi:hypothetical protein